MFHKIEENMAFKTCIVGIAADRNFWATFYLITLQNDLKPFHLPVRGLRPHNVVLVTAIPDSMSILSTTIIIRDL